MLAFPVQGMHPSCWSIHSALWWHSWKEGPVCYTSGYWSQCKPMFKGCSRNYPGGVGRKHFFVRWGEGVLLTVCPRGGGWKGNLSWGSRHIWSIVGRSWGSGGSDSLCVLGVEGSEKKCGPPPPPQDKFWNSPKWSAGIILLIEKGTNSCKHLLHVVKVY